MHARLRASRRENVVQSWHQKTLRWLTDALYVVAAIGCFALAIYSIWLNRAGSAGVAATFAVAFLFLRHLPIIESFKAFNMEAKFAKRVDESEKILSYIRSAAEVSSKLLYMQLGYLNRMASITWGRKRELMGQLDANLQQLGVDGQFIQDAKRPVLNFATWDLYSVFRGSADALLAKKRDKITRRQKEIQSGGPIRADDPEWNELHQRRQELILPRDDFEDMAGPTKLENVGELIEQVLKGNFWTEDDLTILRLVGSEVEKLAQACWAQGTVTPEAEAYIEQFGGRNDDRLQAFQRQLSDQREGEI
jgi:hypothetical protein